jgi:hypothetical protein
LKSLPREQLELVVSANERLEGGIRVGWLKKPEPIGPQGPDDATCIHCFDGERVVHYEVQRPADLYMDEPEPDIPLDRQPF